MLKKKLEAVGNVLENSQGKTILCLTLGPLLGCQFPKI